MKKDYKLIVSDFDGTLAGKDGIISPKDEEAINKWVHNGKSFSIATGRQYAMIKDEVEKLGITTPQITRGGAEIVDPKTGKVIYSKLMNEGVVTRFLELIQSQGYNFLLEEGDKLYGTMDFRYKNPHVTFLPFSKFTMKDIPKIVVFLDGKNLEKAELFLDEKLVKEFPELHLVRSYSPLGKVWDITSLEATKHLAVLELLKLGKLKREETVGVGDGYNDFPLLEACGLKVAMGNAVEDLKAIADIVVPPYTEDGVAFLINKLLKDEK